MMGLYVALVAMVGEWVFSNGRMARTKDDCKIKLSLMCSHTYRFIESVTVD